MVYRFGRWEVDPSLFELRRDGVAVPVQRLTFDTLVYLIEHRDRVVTRDELLAGPWRGTHVSDGAVSQSICVVRKALDDDGERQEIIRTVRGRGFRFVAPVDVVRRGLCRRSSRSDDGRRTSRRDARHRSSLS